MSQHVHFAGRRLGFGASGDGHDGHHFALAICRHLRRFLVARWRRRNANHLDQIDVRIGILGRWTRIGCDLGNHFADLAELGGTDRAVGEWFGNRIGLVDRRGRGECRCLVVN